MKQKEEEFKKGQIAIRKEDIWKRPKKRRRYEESDDDDEDEKMIDETGTVRATTSQIA